MSTLARVAAVFEEVLKVDRAKVSRATVPEDVKKWDSLGHMALVAGLEKEFGLELEVDEIMEMATVEKILEVLARRGVVDEAASGG